MKKIIPAMMAMTLSLMMAAAASAEFHVHCVDASGAPVVGAKIQLCTDNECMMKKSGEDGDAVFLVDAGVYTIHAYKIPEGYEAPAEITTTAADADATLVFGAETAAAADDGDKTVLWANTFTYVDADGKEQQETVKVTLAVKNIVIEPVEDAQNNLADGYFAKISREGVAPVTVAITPACVGAHANLNQATDEELQQFIAIVGEQFENPASDVHKTESGNVYLSVGTDVIRSVWTIYEDAEIEIIQANEDYATPLTAEDQNFAVEILQGLWME